MNEKEILNEIKHFDDKTKIDLIEKILQMLKQPEDTKVHVSYSLEQLSGLGKELWKEDPNAYVQSERDSWK